MIKNVCFKSKWINDKHKQIKADPILIEKAIFAFELLGNLIENGLNLMFKGGTCLMLLIPELKRLSIDLDIISNEENKTLEKIFNVIIKQGTFNRWNVDTRISDNIIPKKHFKFYYISPLTNTESYILLDTLQVDSPFPKTIKKSIVHPIFEIEKEVKVTVPTINGLTGDKLTAFAPTTTGIPYEKEKSMEIIKQLFDLGVLFEYISDLKEISHIYERIAKIEARFRKIEPNIENFLIDTIEACFLISQLDFRQSSKSDYTKEIRDGIRRIKSHILGGKYSLLNAKEDASKVACLAFLIKDNRLDIDIEKLRQNRRNVEKIKDAFLPEKFGILNKLKSISPESFYLWAIATESS